jgi:hypothetical protein
MKQQNAMDLMSFGSDDADPIGQDVLQPFPDWTEVSRFGIQLSNRLVLKIL